MSSSTPHTPVASRASLETSAESSGIGQVPSTVDLATHSRHSSQSATSDYSPGTPTFSSDGTPHLSSSTSSLYSLSSRLDQLDYTVPFTPTKWCAPDLPDVLEHPAERDSNIRDPNERISFERILEEQAHMADSIKLNDTQEKDEWTQRGLRNDAPHSDVLDEALAGCFVAGTEAAFDTGLKRGRSSGAALNTFASRVITRLPSLSKRKGRKKLSIPRSEGNSGVSSPVQARSRSNSRARSLPLFGRSDVSDDDIDDTEDTGIPDHFETIEEVDHDFGADELQPFQPACDDKTNAKDGALERVHTPLLPALMESAPPHGVVAGPEATKSANGPGIVETDRDISNGVSSVHRFRPGGSLNVPHQEYNESEEHVSRSGFSSGVLDDKWSDKLGHADFTIFPEPYLPNQFNFQTSDKLLADWHRARSEYSKHLARTSKNFGDASRTYRLTEEKWADIDALWKQNYDDARCMVSMTVGTPPNSPSEPAPVVKIPSLDDKFPQLHDYEIVGPMERVEPPDSATGQAKHMQSKKAGLMKLLGGLNKRARSASGPC